MDGEGFVYGDFVVQFDAGYGTQCRRAATSRHTRAELANLEVVDIIRHLAKEQTRRPGTTGNTNLWSHVTG